MTMNGLTKIEQAVMDSIGSVWKVYGIEANEWSMVWRKLDAQEDTLSALMMAMHGEEYQLVRDLKNELNFLYWFATAHDDAHDAENYNPYHHRRAA
jgi:hypothetical protein